MKKIVLKIFLFLVMIELILRLINLSINLHRAESDFTHNDNKKYISILALGESTTDQSFVGENNKSWPLILKEKLTSMGYHVRVYNEGVIGTNSALILSRLDTLLLKYHPDFVITMIGINDSHGIPIKYIEEDLLSRVKLFFFNLRIWKILHWTKVTLSDIQHSEILDNVDLPNDLLPFVKMQTKFSKESEIKKVEELYFNKLHDPKLVSLALNTTAYNILDSEHFNKDSIAVYQYFKRAYELYPSNYINLFSILQESQKHEPLFCVKVSKEAVKFGTHIPDGILAMMAKCLVNDNNSGFISILNSRKLIFDQENKNFTSYHYKLIHQKIINANSKHIAMQYPTLPIEQLKELLDNKTDIIYIENNSNFREALNRLSYNEIFIDHFAGLWGHATLLGNQLIANNIVETITKTIKLKH